MEDRQLVDCHSGQFQKRQQLEPQERQRQLVHGRQVDPQELQCFVVGQGTVEQGSKLSLTVADSSC